jgi:16S rRNA (guanine1207-N2)-methyltransferase
VKPVTQAGDNRAVDTEHYFTADPSAAPAERDVEFSLFDRDYRLVASGGVFSSARLDPGTAVLLHKGRLPAPDSTGPLLDLGCGYGPIAVVLATTAPRATIYAVDVNERALGLVRRNAETVGAASRVVPALPDDVPADLRFTEIWSNPPIRIGKDALHDLLDRWLPRLVPDGVAWLVVARHLGGDSLQRWLTERGWHVDRHASQKGYRIFRVRAAPGSPDNA